MVRERGERPSDPQPPATKTPIPEAASAYEPPVNWWRLDAQERAETLGVLFEWVPELVRRYGLRDSEIPPCWFRHEAMVQELLALFQYRNQQQFTPGANPGAANDFHYQFQLFLQRMRSWAGTTGCRTGEHNPTVLQAWADPANSSSAVWQVSAEEYLSSSMQDWEQEEMEQDA